MEGNPGLLEPGFLLAKGLEVNLSLQRVGKEFLAILSNVVWFIPQIPLEAVSIYSAQAIYL